MLFDCSIYGKYHSSNSPAIVKLPTTNSSNLKTYLVRILGRVSKCEHHKYCLYGERRHDALVVQQILYRTCLLHSPSTEALC